ncbi:protein DEEPER ROOTING 1-like isoform X1 [Solanum lycopersicum]|uniref:Uncharacterized protein n=1 Tax=Solanum lycopersicum TaxID=4081 RepID=A0A3Q7HC25_SOLLC|nr:uncharacterized protein LOC101261934 isoform X1 [Solanum lycopersicum]
MKIFSWIQTKFNGKQTTCKSNPVAVTHHMLHQEFSDWPNELLAIGTFGSLKNDGKLKQQDQSLTVEEVGQLHKELKHLFPDHEESNKIGSNKDLDKFFDCLQNLVDDDDHRVIENKENIFKRSNSTLVHVRSQEQSSKLDNMTNTGISKKSLSYLLKKTLFCSAGFAAPLRDNPLLPHSKIQKSRMEKILRAILHKKIYPQANSPRGNGSTTRKRYIDNTCVIESDTDQDDEAFDTTVKNGSKWDKSDSDFIVLEI